MSLKEASTSARELGFVPSDLGFVANPYPVYRELRDRFPVLHDDDTDHWL
ncbi:MAG: hypothetical protein HY658_02705, partial [Actinobacteria bacterium]|nr:hypothetical protein [Actinomycetota bacterium]